jgi:hypothetical protein
VLHVVSAKMQHNQIQISDYTGVSCFGRSYVIINQQSPHNNVINLSAINTFTCPGVYFIV